LKIKEAAKEDAIQRFQSNRSAVTVSVFAFNLLDVIFVDH